ncbi:hypothetical protein [Chryseobacterium sp. MP_3.2]|uniref:hypothetical protein n=1 Tax=Chryseobacterium sp. MP_3.2 TaxID=3071712 RepID=UPI002DFBACD4|nr:hypothetical protein [Chryseobacterium sp. MP_3.2]
MLKEKFQLVIAVALSALGLKELPKGADGKLALDAEQEKILQATYTGTHYEAFVKAANDILAEEQGLTAAADAEKIKANALLASVLKGNAGGEEGGPPSVPATPTAVAQKVVDVVQQQAATIDALMKAPEDKPSAVNANRLGLVGLALVASFSTSTHLFGTNPEASNKIFAFEGRNWNQRAAGKSAATTDFSDVSTVTRLNQDLKDYQNQNPTFLRDLYVDKYGLPEFWPKRVGVLDRVTDGVMDIGSVTQARKPDWTPGFEMFLQAETRRIYRIQIDLEFSGYQLQEFENSWLNTIFNFDGSTPYKHTFIAYLISKIDEKARQEDREGAVNGIFAPNIKGIKMKGHYLNAQSGIRHQLFMFRDVLKTIAPYISKVGKFSSANAYDYVKGLVESLPNGIKKRPNQYLYISPSNLVKVRDAYHEINKLNNNYNGSMLNYIDGYPNIQFYGLEDLEGSNLMFVTDKDNIEIMEYRPAEKSKYEIEELKRDSFIFADYRFGVGFVFSGFDLPSNDYKGIAQFIWINDEPIFPATVSVPLFGAPMSATVNINYNRLHVHPELVADVTKLQGLPAGTIVEIIGDKLMTNTNKILKKTGTNGGNLDLTADFAPKTMYKLIMAIQPDGLYKELARVTDFPNNTVATVTFDELVIDLADGQTQKYEGAAGTVTSIIGGNESTELTIYGSESALTIASVTEKIVMTSSAVLDSDVKFVTLKNFGGVWYDIARG